MDSYTLIAKDKEARTGILKTKAGSIETPFFMPVATKTAVKYLSSDDLDEMRVPAVISNSFILSLRPGVEVIRKSEGIGKFMRYDGVHFTDSGGFQMYQKKFWVKTDEHGITFRNPFSGEKLLVTPEQSMEIQLALGGEVSMCLDHMPLIEDSRDEIAKAVAKTTLWARRCKAHHDRLQQGIPSEKRQLLFGITQGGIHADLRRKSIEELKVLDFDGYSLGGLALGEPEEDEMKMIELQRSLIPENKPLYLMGAGDPQELLNAIERGVEMFDSRFPTQNARRRTLFTWQGRLRIGNKRYEYDQGPIDTACGCFVCKKYSRAFIRYLLVQGEPTGKRLATYHNIYFLQRLMEQAREAIREGRFHQWKEKIEAVYRE